MVRFCPKRKKVGAFAYLLIRQRARSPRRWQHDTQTCTLTHGWFRSTAGNESVESVESVARRSEAGGGVARLPAGGYRQRLPACARLPSACPQCTRYSSNGHERVEQLMGCLHTCALSASAMWCTLSFSHVTTRRRRSVLAWNRCDVIVVEWTPCERDVAVGRSVLNCSAPDPATCCERLHGMSIYSWRHMIST